MKAAKITAKLRDAVPVCLYADGNEQARYKNIEIPDEIKALEIMDFRFDIDATGWTSFHLYFDQGILPDEMPEPRPLITREQKRAAKANVINTADLAAAAAEVIAAAGGTNIAVTPATGKDYTIATAEGAIIAEIHHDDLTAPEQEECSIRFDVPGKKRAALARAIGDILACEAEYQNPPSYAYKIGALTLERDGTLHGPDMAILLPLLAEQGFTPAE